MDGEISQLLVLLGDRWLFVGSVAAPRRPFGIMLPDHPNMFKTHLPLDKMAAIPQSTFFSALLWIKSFVLIKISLKVVPKGPINRNPTLVWIKAWRRIGDKPLSEPMLIRFTDTYVVLGGDEFNRHRYNYCVFMIADTDYRLKKPARKRVHDHVFSETLHSCNQMISRNSYLVH